MVSDVGSDVDGQSAVVGVFSMYWFMYFGSDDTPG